MGRGDRKTKKGKTAIRSYGNARPHKAVTAVTSPAKKAAATKTAAAKPAVKKAAPAAKKAAPAKKPAA